MGETAAPEDGCIAATPPSELALMAAADGEADEATAAHLNECPVCAQRVAALRLFEARLRRQFYRLFCPPTETLLEYRQGWLNPDERRWISGHLAICPHCAHELTLIERISETLEPLQKGPDSTTAIRPRSDYR